MQFTTDKHTAVMIISMQDIIFTLKLNTKMLNINICINLTKVSNFL